MDVALAAFTQIPVPRSDTPDDAIAGGVGAGGGLSQVQDPSPLHRSARSYPRHVVFPPEEGRCAQTDPSAFVYRAIRVDRMIDDRVRSTPDNSPIRSISRSSSEIEGAATMAIRS